MIKRLLRSFIKYIHLIPAEVPLYTEEILLEQENRPKDKKRKPRLKLKNKRK